MYMAVVYDKCKFVQSNYINKWQSVNGTNLWWLLIPAIVFTFWSWGAISSSLANMYFFNFKDCLPSCIGVPPILLVGCHITLLCHYTILHGLLPRQVQHYYLERNTIPNISKYKIEKLWLQILNQHLNFSPYP